METWRGVEILNGAAKEDMAAKTFTWKQREERTSFQVRRP